MSFIELFFSISHFNLYIIIFFNLNVFLLNNSLNKSWNYSSNQNDFTKTSEKREVLIKKFIFTMRRHGRRSPKKQPRISSLDQRTTGRQFTSNNNKKDGKTYQTIQTVKKFYPK